MKAGLWTRAAAERRRELEKKVLKAMQAKNTAFGGAKPVSSRRSGPTSATNDGATAGRPVELEGGRAARKAGEIFRQRLVDARRRDALLNKENQEQQQPGGAYAITHN